MSLGISSVLINSVEYISAVKFDGFQIQYATSSRIGVATFSLDSAPASLVVSPGHVVKIYDSTSTLRFQGTVAKIEPVAIMGGSATTRYKLTVRDYATLLDQALITGPVSYGGKTDQFIILALLAAYVPSLGTSHIDSTTTLDIITFENISVRQALEKICQQTGAQFYVDASLDLQYHSPSGSAAPFSVSETPNNTTSFPTLVQSLAPVQDFSNGANYVRVIGAIGDSGTQSEASVQDGTSQGLYGILHRTIIDRSLQSNAACTARANIELANYKNPQISGTLAVRQTGLVVGQLLTVSLPSVNVSGSFLIQQLTLKWDSQNDVKYEVQYGAYLPDMFKWLRSLATDPPQQPITPVATIPTGIISIADFAASVRPVAIVTSLPTLPDTNYPSNSPVVLTSDGLLYRNNGGTWAKVVNTTDLSGTVSAAQIAAGAIVAGKIAANAVTVGTIAAGVVTGTVISATASIKQTNIGGSGVTTDITQLFDSTIGFTGLSVYTTSGGASGARISLAPVGLAVADSSGNVTIDLALAGGVPVLALAIPSGKSSSLSPTQLLLASSASQPLALIGTGSTPFLQISNTSGTSRVFLSNSSDHGYIQFNNTSLYALMTDTLYKKDVHGFTQMSSGTLTLSAATMGLSTIDHLVASLISGSPSEDIGIAWTPGGTSAVFTSSNGASSSFVSWRAKGNP